MVGVLGTWRSSGPVSLNGLEGPHNGWLVVLFGLIALSGVRALSRGSWFGVVDVVGSAAVMAFTAIEDLVNDNAALGGSAGWGVWLTIAASVLLGGAALAVGAGRLAGRAQRK
jgi:hypothetical protein